VARLGRDGGPPAGARAPGSPPAGQARRPGRARRRPGGRAR